MGQGDCFPLVLGYSSSLSLELQPVSFERMSAAVVKIHERLLLAAKCLEEAGVAYAVVGESAVAAWVSRVDEAAVRNTRDVDILIRREDLSAAIAAMEAGGFIHRRISSLGQASHMDVFLDGPDAKARDAVHVVFASERVKDDALAEALIRPRARSREISGSFHWMLWSA